MLNFLVNFIILSCVFNICYYCFDLEEKVQKYIRELQLSMIAEMEKRDPFHPLLKDLRSIPVKNLDDTSILKLILDMLFFPINLMLILIIIVDKLMKK